jgi:peptidoglycan biosynthesis protein MviN/MurJ (putative lipid II flippase)
VVPTDLVKALFEYGAFKPADTPYTAYALAIFALGLPSFVLIKVFSPAFFARQDTKTPMRYAGWSLTLNTIGSVALFFVFRSLGWMPHLGIAVATTIGGWMNAILLWRGLQSRGYFTADDQFKRSLPRIVLSSLSSALRPLLDIGPLHWRQHRVCGTVPGTHGADWRRLGSLRHRRNADRRHPGKPIESRLPAHGLTDWATSASPCGAALRTP